MIVMTNARTGVNQEPRRTGWELRGLAEGPVLLRQFTQSGHTLHTPSDASFSDMYRADDRFSVGKYITVITPDGSD